MSKQCSRGRWQGIEKFIAFIIGGVRVLGQSEKHAAKRLEQEEIAFGDVKSEFFLGECKAIDPAAGTKWRKDNKNQPAKTFSVKCKWIDQIREEAKQLDKIPFLAVNRKFTKKMETHIILDLGVFIDLINLAGMGKFKNLDEANRAWQVRSLDDD